MSTRRWTTELHDGVYYVERGTERIGPYTPDACHIIADALNRHNLITASLNTPKKYIVVEAPGYEQPDGWKYGVTLDGNDDVDDWVAAFDGPFAFERASREAAWMNEENS